VFATGYGRVAGHVEILARGPQTAPGSSEVAIVGLITLQRL